MVHPPLGKQLIAAGIRAFGYDSFGWRFSAAIAGVLMVALLFLLARRLLRSTSAATLAAGLLAVDWLGFVQSRIAMLDIFAALFGLGAVLFTVLDRDTGRHRGRLWRPWRLAAGIAAGAALASKWSGAFAVVTVLVLALSWELGKYRSRGGAGTRSTLRHEAPSIALYLVVVPVAVYALSYLGRIDGAIVAVPWSPEAWARALWDRQRYMFSFHSGLEVTHAYQSPPWSWPLLKRPVSYYFETTPAGHYMEIFAAGSPLVWWSSLGALAYMADRWLRRVTGAGAGVRGVGGLGRRTPEKRGVRGVGGLGRRTPESAAPEGVVLAAFAIGYFPWFVMGAGRPAVFMFYLLPVVPFMCLALAYVAARLERAQAARPAIGLFCAGVVVLFAFYYPLLAKRPLPREAWLDRIWIFDDCTRPSGAEVGTSEAGRAIESTETDGDEDLPPTGWCWI
jgi:dolichyl-phosphate-mannose--protein O-mannosyl transferase